MIVDNNRNCWVRYKNLIISGIPSILGLVCAIYFLSHISFTFTFIAKVAIIVCILLVKNVISAFYIHFIINSLVKNKLTCKKSCCWLLFSVCIFVSKFIIQPDAVNNQIYPNHHDISFSHKLEKTDQLVCVRSIYRF